MSGSKRDRGVISCNPLSPLSPAMQPGGPSSAVYASLLHCLGQGKTQSLAPKGPSHNITPCRQSFISPRSLPCPQPWPCSGRFLPPPEIFSMTLKPWPRGSGLKSSWRFPVSQCCVEGSLQHPRKSCVSPEPQFANLQNENGATCYSKAMFLPEALGEDHSFAFCSF